VIKAVFFDLYETLITDIDTAPPRASKLGAAHSSDDAVFMHRVEGTKGDLPGALGCLDVEPAQALDVGDAADDELARAGRSLRAARLLGRWSSRSRGLWRRFRSCTIRAMCCAS